ncbi:branched-chain amino acid ABC transporter permease [Shimia sp. MMG029]|uniref:branched-chain amino acid ABC transporter permease n=1 Tax=Shimia sp. MMG029 TaxID=3021978 RepID=UPI0022FDC2E2|nr:branched-chain amino acid ABC transporter permease [Shimia sp. MMG029]MDA5555904.1 branched-chain amino acid ABC transporter permease [Shimia sp. MMG029]
MTADLRKIIWLHGTVLVILFAAQFFLPAYHHGNLARIMVLATYAMGYNLLFGYTGLLSLGHALFFAAGLYGMGLGMTQFGLGAGAAVVLGVVAGAGIGALIGALALRTEGVAFMIVTLMFAQVGYLIILYFGSYTRGDEGFVIQQADRLVSGLDLSDPTVRYFAAFSIFCTAFVVLMWVLRSRFGHVLIAIRENEERAMMLGYDVQRYKWGAVVLSAGVSALAGAAYGVLFGYVGASFASVQYSIFPLLWVLLGGAGTMLGPLVGTIFMFYLIDLSSGVTTAYMLIAGIVLVCLTLFAPQGLMGELRNRFWRWLP